MLKGRNSPYEEELLMYWYSNKMQIIHSKYAVVLCCYEKETTNVFSCYS